MCIGFISYNFLYLVCIRYATEQPIDCWMPQEFSDNHQKQFALSYCWSSSTYSIMPDILLIETPKRVSYYRWTPVVLAFQALLFYLPGFICRGLMSFSQWNASSILQSAGDSCSMIADESKKKVVLIAQYINQQRASRRGVNNILVILYLLTKLFYFFNLFGQLFLIEKFVGTSGGTLGNNVMKSLFGGQRWDQTSNNLPRDILCEMETRSLERNRRYIDIYCFKTINI